MTVTLGEPEESASNSERYMMRVGSKVITNTTYGIEETFTFGLPEGTSNKITITWEATDPDSKFYPDPDYDYVAAVTCACGVVEDPGGILQSYAPENKTSYFPPAGKSALLIIPKVDSVTSEVKDGDGRTVPRPGETAMLRAVMLPYGRLSAWALESVRTDKRSAAAVSFTTNAADDGLDFHLDAESGSGWVTFRIKDSELEDACSTSFTFRVGCEDCGDEEASGSACGPCGDTGGACAFSSASFDNGSVNASFGLGPIGPHRTGQIRLYAETPSIALATPAALDFSSARGGDAVILSDSNRVPRQIRTSYGLVDVVVSNAFKYMIFYYLTADQGTRNACVGLYEPDPADSIVTYTIENPDASTNTFNRLRIVENSQGNVISNEYIFSASTTNWALGTGSGLSTNARQRIVLGGGNVKYVETVADPSGAIVYQDERTFSTNLGRSLIVEETIDPGGVSNTTRSTYFSNPALGSYGKLESVTHADGSWSRYAYDSAGRVTNVVRSYKDAAADVPASQAAESVYDYTPIGGSGDANASEDAFTARTVRERVLGTTVSLTYRVFTTNAQGDRIEIEEQCLDGAAAYGNTNNLRRTTTWFATGSGTSAGRLKLTQRPDGTEEGYTYELGTYTTNANPALNAFSPATNGTYLQTTVVHGTAAATNGVANRTTLARTVEDANDREVLRETYVYTGSGYDRIDWTATVLDARGRRVGVNHANGTHEDAIWSCCGLEYEVGVSGVTNQFLRDALKRVTSQVQFGSAEGVTNAIFTSYVYDGAGRVVLETRTGSGLSLVTSNAYNKAGQLTQTVDPAGLVTTYGYASGGRVTTNTLPGGATIVSENYLDGSAKAVTGTGTIAETHDKGVNGDGTQWQTVYSGPNGTNSPVWRRTVTDLLGRTVREERPGYGGTVLTNASHYNAIGQLVRTTAPNRADTLNEYDSLGELVRSGLDINGNGALDLAGSDRISESAQRYEHDGTNWWRLSASALYPTAGSSTVVTTDVQKVLLTGLSTGATSRTVQRDIFGQDTVTATAIAHDSQQMVTTVDVPDSASNLVTVAANGVMVLTTGKDGTRRTFGYDGLGRQIRAVDPRTGTNVTVYNAKGQVAREVDAAGGTNAFTYAADTGWLVIETNALGLATRLEYDEQGRAIRTWGDSVYPESRTWDDFGRPATLSTYRGGTGWTGATWPASPGTADTTTWQYETATGLLTNKLYADGKGTRYTYTSDGQIATRVWARGITTTYSNTNTTGELLLTDYSDATPDVTNAYDRLGRLSQVGDGQGVRTFAYSPATLQLTNETIVTATRTNVLAHGVDALGRADSLRLNTHYAVTYGFDSVGRYSAITGVTHSVTTDVAYVYLADSGLIQRRLMARGAITNTWSYEAARDLVTQVETRASVAGTGTLISQYAYVSDALGRRTNRTDRFGSAVPSPTFWTNAFAYNVRSELTNATQQVGATSNVWRYAYDEIGNRTSYASNALTRAYQASALNQYTNVSGTNFLYDQDGNLMSDGVRTNTWDAENRLVESAPITPVSFNQKAVMTYDYQARRTQKTVSTFIAGNWTTSSVNTVVYDGWHALVEERTSGSRTNSYVWGLDLSGGLQGAGGVGGLVSHHLRSGSENTAAYACTDANGNVMQMLNAASPTNVIAAFDYDPYGHTTKAAGNFALFAFYRFSTKYADTDSQLLYYGYRYYSPYLGRWISQDPLSHQGGPNQYSFVHNGPIDQVDYLGLLSQTHPVGRRHVASGRVRYSCNCGWIDMDHAFAQQELPAEAILGPINDYYGGGPKTFSFGVPHVVKRPWFKWEIRSSRDQLRANLARSQLMMAIWMKSSWTIEQWQGNSYRSVFGSSFSVEDLPSNYLAGLMSINKTFPALGLKEDRIRSVCVILDSDDSIKVLDNGDGPSRNYKELPLLWKPRTYYTECWPCKDHLERVPAGVFDNVLWRGSVSGARLLDTNTR